ncbi:cardiolipin synthase [Rubritalea profundi]|uniref:Cardiolipin synthase n=1 Tax=Rubritalea profundi TaxID=1658618 RepID=A0A2S7U261_9BACT|nr:cardiolipin synthase [Rubritalea profundi]PQJ28484.1 cardiolipin synthase [Rubritalea profundi]
MDESPIIEVVKVIWPFVATALHILGACAVTLHAILRKKDVKSAVAWIGLAWLSPIIGSIAYLILGINRIQRTGVSLGLTKVWDHDPDQDLTEDEKIAIHHARLDHPSLIGLVKLGTRLIGKPLLMGNTIEPLINGDAAYPEMLKAIDNAEVSVALNSYIFDSDRVGEQFLTALINAQQRGLEVRVMIDGVGSRYSKPSMVGRLNEAGINVAAFLPSRAPLSMVFANLRNHRKILVIDGKVGFTGGTNIREGHSLNLKPVFPVACLHFRIDGPAVSELQEAFAIDWAFTTKEELNGPTWFPTLERSGPVIARGVPDGPDEDLDKINEMILGALSVARHRVRIITPYFLPSDSILDALAVTAMRGVQVDILLPSKNNIAIMNWAVIPQLPRLIEKGCNIHTSPAPFDHTKLLVVDHLWSLIGSTNWDARSMRLNFEYNLECYDAELAEKLDTIIDEKLARATLITLDEINARTLPARLRDGAARLFSPYL